MPFLLSLFLFLVLTAGHSAHSALINFRRPATPAIPLLLRILRFFEKYGHTVRLIFIPGASVSIAALVNRDVQMAQLADAVDRQQCQRHRISRSR